MISGGAGFQSCVDRGSGNSLLRQLLLQCNELSVITGLFATMGRAKHLAVLDHNRTHFWMGSVIRLRNTFSCLVDGNASKPAVIVSNITVGLLRKCLLPAKPYLKVTLYRCHDALDTSVN